MRPGEQSKSRVIDENLEKLNSLYNDIFEGLSAGIKEGFAEGVKRGMEDALKTCFEDDLQLEITDLPNQIFDNRISGTAKDIFEKTIEDIFESLLHHIADEVNKENIIADWDEIATINAEIDKQQKEALKESLENLNSALVKQVAKGIADILNLTWAVKFKDYEEIVKRIKPGTDVLSISIKTSADTTHEKIKETIQEATKEVVLEIAYNIIKRLTGKTVRKFTREVKRSLFRNLKRDPGDLSDSEIEKLADERQKELLEKVINSKNEGDYIKQIHQVFESGLRSSLRRLLAGIKPIVVVLAIIAVLIILGGTAFGIVSTLGDEDEESVFLEADFNASPTSGPTPLEVEFFELSSGEVSDWEWDFGDGQTSDEQNPSHIYYEPGDYTVSLEITGPGGSDIATRYYYIDAYDIRTIADFDYEVYTYFSASLAAVSPVYQVAFTDLSASDEGIVSWEWDFGDEQTSNLQNPKLFMGMGTYNVNLTVREDDGDFDTIEKQISVP